MKKTSLSTHTRGVRIENERQIVSLSPKPFINSLDKWLLRLSPIRNRRVVLWLFNQYRVNFQRAFIVQASKNNFLDHVRFLRQAVLASGGDLIIAGNSMQALIRHGTTHWVLHPQFLVTIDGVTQYTHAFGENATHFVGWLPYQSKRWPIASDKLAFKRFAENTGLKVPQFSTDPRADLNNVVVKRATSSFGEQVHGPFRSSREQAIDVAQGEYYDSFIEGHLLKIWYWDAEPVCVELDNMPSVQGDGISTVGELMVRRASLNRTLNEVGTQRMFDKSEALLRYYGATISTVLRPQSRQLVEFRYGSNLMHMNDRTVIDLQAEPSPQWAASLRTTGQQLHTAITESERRGTVFTVDAVLDQQQNIWLLEMNSNPTIHPLVYPRIVASLLPTSPASLLSEEQPYTSELTPQQPSIPQSA